MKSKNATKHIVKMKTFRNVAKTCVHRSIN